MPRKAINKTIKKRRAFPRSRVQELRREINRRNVRTRNSGPSFRRSRNSYHRRRFDAVDLGRNISRLHPIQVCPPTVLWRPGNTSTASRSSRSYDSPSLPSSSSARSNSYSSISTPTTSAPCSSSTISGITDDSWTDTIQATFGSTTDLTSRYRVDNDTLSFYSDGPTLSPTRSSRNRPFILASPESPHD